MCTVVRQVDHGREDVLHPVVVAQHRSVSFELPTSRSAQRPVACPRGRALQLQRCIEQGRVTLYLGEPNRWVELTERPVGHVAAVTRVPFPIDEYAVRIEAQRWRVVDCWYAGCQQASEHHQHHRRQEAAQHVRGLPHGLDAPLLQHHCDV